LAQPAQGPGPDSIEVMPVVVLSQVFPARPSSIPDIRDFVRRCLSDQGNREVGETVFRALLDAAGPTGSIQVAFRIFPEHVEVDVLHSDSQIQAGLLPNGVNPATPNIRTGPAAPAGVAAGGGTPAGAAASGAGGAWAAGVAAAAGDFTPTPAEPVALGQPGQPATFAEWMSTALRRQGLTQEAAARQLGVSVKTVSRWVGGATEPRMRDLRRIQEVFGEVPLP